MDKKKNTYETEISSVPTFRLIIGDVPSPDPDRRNKVTRPLPKSVPDMQGTVKRIIARLEKE